MLKYYKHNSTILKSILTALLCSSKIDFINIKGITMELEQRVEKLEHNVAELRVDVAAIKAQIPYLATHADIQTAISRLLMWLIGVGLASLTSIVIGILNYLK